MKADYAKALGLLSLGFLSILLLASFSLEDPRMNMPTQESSPSATTFLFNLQPGIFHPLTEEYLRQQAKELPYALSESELFLEPKKSGVFEPNSPLELALLSDEEPLHRKKKSRALPMGEADRGGSWRPPTEEEREKWEREIAAKAIEMGSGLADSLSMPYLTDGILWTTQRFNAYRHHLADQYRLHFKVSKDDAAVTYQVKY